MDKKFSIILLIIFAIIISRNLSEALFTGIKGIIYLIIFIRCISYFDESISSNILKFITEIINTNTDINNNDTIISFSTNKIKDGTQKIIKSAYNTFSQYNNNLLRTKETKNKNLLSIAP